MTYITSLISGVGIFCFGTGLSWYHGFMAIIDPPPLESLSWALALLSIAAVSETVTLLMACYDIKSSARKIGIGFWPYVLQGYKPSVNVVLLEDIAAVSGVFIAAGCMTLTYVTGNHLYDACGSLLIGCVLGSVASFIIYTNTIALVGRSIPQKKITNISGDIESDIMIRSIYDIKATDLGGQTVMFKAEVDIDGREITRSYLERLDIEKLLEETQNITNVQDLETYFLKHGENIGNFKYRYI
jgi:zinc transporter 9